MSEVDVLVSIGLGLGLAAATGFRIFLPMLILSVGAQAGWFPLSDDLAWLGTRAAAITLGVAALVEILAYYNPGIDNLLDTLATPAAVIAGGGAAGLTQGATAAMRANSTAFTAGTATSSSPPAN